MRGFNPRTHTGCDIVHVASATASKRFNPRTHTGCDMSMAAVVWDRNGVSIHAPTRGATTTSSTTQSIFGSFNPRTHTGCDELEAMHVSSFAYVSIHAPTRGATREKKLTPSVVEFQSTHPHGVRHRRIIANYIIIDVSIHAPTRGATDLPLRRTLSRKVSIHAPTRGATFVCTKFFYCKVVSIHAPTRGATCWQGLRSPIVLFQSTHPHGVRLLKNMD